MTGTAEDALDSRFGWTIVAMGFAMLVMVWGTIFTFTVYAGGLAGAFGLSSLETSSLFSITTAAFFVVGGSIGVVVARMPLRPVLAAAGLTLGLGAALVQLVSSYGGLAVAFALVGLAGGTIFVVVISLVPQWFDEYEGRAMGVTMTGNGLGVLVMPFLWIWLLDAAGVRLAFGAIGAVGAGVVLLSSLVYRRPGDSGWSTGSGSTAASVDARWLRKRFSDRRFLVALAGYPLVWSWYFVLSSSLVEVLTTAGIARTLAATAFGTVGGISVLARLASGAAADRFGPRSVFTFGVVLAGFGLVVLRFTAAPPSMWLSLGLFGVGLGALATLFPPIVVGRFGSANATAAVGLFTVAEATTAFGVPIGLNLLYGLTGGYAVPLGLMAGITFAGAGLFYWGTAPAAGR